MDTSGFIARRYLFSKKHISLISTLTVISIVGVTIGTALLIVVLSVFNGFFDVIKNLLLSSDPDIRIESTVENFFTFDESLQQSLEEIPEIIQISPYVEGKALLVLGDQQNEVVQVKGVDQNNYFVFSRDPNKVTSGVFDNRVRGRRPGVMFSNGLANAYGISLNEEVALLSARGMKRALTQISLPRMYRFQLRGTFSVQQVTAGETVIVDMVAAQRLFNARDQISGIDLKLQDNDQAESLKKELQAMLGPDFRISSWYDLQKPLYDVMYLEKWGSYIILMIIVIVAVLNILGSLTMIVIQKQRDIALLISMGLSSRDIKNIFRKQGLYIGLIGCGIGGSLGLLLSWLQNKYGLLKLSSAFIIDAYPSQISAVDISLVLLASLLLCILASWYPSNRAARINPADALRYE
jgi:lipoprotein-releasing system permease protein